MSQVNSSVNPEQWLAQFVNLLLECPVMQTAAEREKLRLQLPASLRFDVPDQTGRTDRQAVTALVSYCAGREGGQAGLLAALRHFEDGTEHFTGVTAFLEANPVPPPAAFSQDGTSPAQVVRQVSMGTRVYNAGSIEANTFGGISVVGGTVQGNITYYDNRQTGPARSPLAPPPPPEHFAGRERELAELEAALQDATDIGLVLLALKGPGGIGKTTLARQLAYQLYTAKVFGAVLWVEVKPGFDRWAVLRRWAGYCGIEVAQTDPDWDTIAESVRAELGQVAAGRALVVFDDVWADGVAGVRELLKALPEGTTVLVTSRDMGVATALETRTLEVATLSHSEAVALLRQYLPAGKWPLLGLDGLARALDGHALALTLAAKRLNRESHPETALPRHLAQYAQGLPTGSALEKLQMGAGFTGKQDSLETALAYSYNVLQPDRQARFRALGALVYDQPFDLRLLTGLWEVPANEEEGMPDEETARAWADELCDLSLIEAATETELGDGWYRQHPVLHAYAAALLGANPEEEAADRDRYYDQATIIAEHFYELQDKPEEWGFLTPYLPHIHATGDALYTLQQDCPDDEVTALRALAFAIYIYSYLYYRQEVHKVEWLQMGLVAAQTVGDRQWESLFLNQLGLYHDNRGDKKQALAYYKQALPIEKKLGDKKDEAATLNNIGKVYDDLEEQAKALEYYEQSLPMRRAVEDRAGEAATLNNIGMVYFALGERAKALEYYDQALPLFQAVADRVGEATTLNNIGLVCAGMGERAKALEYYEQALPLRLAVGDRAGEAMLCGNIGGVYYDTGRLREAVEYMARCVELQEAMQHPNLASVQTILEEWRAELAAQEGV